MESKQNNIIKASRFEIEQQLNNFLGNLKIEGLSGAGKYSLVMLKIELSKIAKEIEDFRKTTIESIDKPKGYTELEVKPVSERTDEEKETFKKLQEEYNDKFTEVALPYFNEVVEIPFNFITEDDFKHIVEHNELNVLFGYEYIYNKLVKNNKDE